MSKKLLIKQLVEKLRTDTGSGGLVSLTTHSTSDIRIARDKQLRKDDTPFLGVMLVDTFPSLGADVTFLKRSLIAIKAYSRDEVKSIDISDRVTFLFDDESGGNTGFYDFSDSSGVSIRMSRYKRTMDSDFDDDTEVWASPVLVEAFWCTQSCGS